MDEPKKKRRLKTKVIDGITVRAETKSLYDESRDTVGAIVTELSQKAPETNSPIEEMEERLTDYDKSLAECVNKAILTYPGDFYVVVLTKKERLLAGVMRLYFFARKTCPTPDYDQCLYHYTRASGLKFMWVVPSKDTCHIFLDSAQYIVPEENELFNFVLQFADGTLMKLAKTLNNEAMDSDLIVA